MQALLAQSGSQNLLPSPGSLRPHSLCFQFCWRWDANPEMAGAPALASLELSARASSTSRTTVSTMPSPATPAFAPRSLPGRLAAKCGPKQAEFTTYICCKEGMGGSWARWEKTTVDGWKSKGVASVTPDALTVVFPSFLSVFFFFVPAAPQCRIRELCNDTR